MQSAIGSRVFRAVLPGRNSILSGSKALQAPHAVPCAVPCASKHSTQQKHHSMWQRYPADPCGAPHVAEKGF